MLRLKENGRLGYSPENPLSQTKSRWAMRARAEFVLRLQRTHDAAQMTKANAAC
jgi:hypothetical protein